MLGFHLDRPAKRMAGETVTDPVRKTRTRPRDTAATSQERGQAYCFCSTSDEDKFERDPARYAAGAAQEHGHGQTADIPHYRAPAQGPPPVRGAL